MTDLYELSAVELGALVRSRQASVTEVTRSHLDRIGATDSEVRAWALVDADGALRTAQQLDEALRRRDDLGPLAGVPVGVKDIIDVRGLPTEAGFEPYLLRGAAGEDAASVATLRKAGMVMLGKTVSVQFAWADDPAATANPWHPDWTPGGSSSGSAAAVAARQVPLALGTQTGGSLIRPAAYCGIVGLKPAHGWISTDGVLPVSWSADHIGVLTRSVADAALLHDVMAGAIGPTVLAASDAPAPNLALVTDLMDRAEPEMRADVEASVDRLRSAGARVVEVRLPTSVDLLLAMFAILSCSEAADVHAEDLAAHADAMRAGARSVAEAGQLIPATALVHAERLRARYRGALDHQLAQVDALVLPSVSGPPPARDLTTGAFDMQTIWSLFGYPSVTLPVDTGRPYPGSVQFVSAKHDVGNLLASARWAERNLPSVAAAL